MQIETIIAGFGGQGVLFAGQVLAYAAMDADKHVTWIPSYGPEMRGGTANCTVIVADEEIGSPLVRNPQAVLAFNLPSLDKYEPLVRSGGVLIANKSLITREIGRDDITVVMIPANEIAEEIADRRMTNMVMLGALLAVQPVLPLENIKQALRDHLPERHQKFLSANFEALEAGYRFAQEAITQPG
ncbi:MAG: 2-oxoacid:ferredoxin oxidoreductase subunit gamma [Anaerolineae bacterium]|nr:MAG: 2-oxoacid:ferredoxin oxidoreductase subunit gamma [Anaerolineae bacterium]